MQPDLKEKQLAKLFQEYEKAASTPGVNAELEIRIREDIERETFEEIIRGASASKEFRAPTLEVSVNIISTKVHGARDVSQSIRKIIYTADGPVDSYMKKTRVVHPVAIPGYLKHAVGLSLEESVPKFFSHNDALVRFKVRVSFDIVDEPWRLDVTAVKQGTLQNLAPQLKQIREEIISKDATAQNIIEELNYEMVSGYEIECEYTGGPTAPADLRVVDKIFGLLNKNYSEVLDYQEAIYAVATQIQPESRRELFRKPTHRLKQLANQVISISMNTYYNDLYPPTGCYATEKLDGVRTIISAGERVVLLFSDGMKQVQATSSKPIIVDAEYVASADSVTSDVNSGGGNIKATKPTIHVFDCMVCDTNISQLGFEVRVSKIEEAVAELQKLMPEYTVVAKKYVKLGTTPAELEAGFRAVYREGAAVENVHVGKDAAVGKDVRKDAPVHESEGVIITLPGDPYHTTGNYKWKPYQFNTIDFLAIKCPKTLLGIAPYVNRRAEGLELYILFVGIDHTQREKLGIGMIAHYKSMFPESTGHYYPIQFSPSAYPLAYLYYSSEDLDRKIVELSRNRANTEWIFHRTRTDRELERGYYGNDYRVAELTFSNYIDPFEFSALWTPPTSYFLKTADDMYVAANKFKRFVISLLLKENISGSKWIIDAAAGRGADLHRYQEIGVENALFIDVDESAITELIRRKYSFMHAKKRHVRSWLGADDTQMRVVTHRNAAADIEYDKLLVKDGKNLTVHTLVADLKMPAPELVEKTRPFGINAGSIDGIVCNFAIHYLCDSAANLTNFLQFVSGMLSVGGVFIFTTMDGAKVFALLEVTSPWEVVEDGEVKYSLRREYEGKKLAPTGQNIAVKLPFSNTPYIEPLCNIDHVIAMAKKYHLELEMHDSMSTHMERFKKADRGLYDRLTDGDRSYIALHSYVTLRKVK